VLRSWFPESAAQPGRKRRGARPGEALPFAPGQFQPHSPNPNARGNRPRPQGPGAPHGNRAAPQGGDAKRGNDPRKPPRGGSPGNSVHEAAPGPYHARPQAPRGPRSSEPRKPQTGGSPGNSIHDGNTSGNRRPGGDNPNRRRGPRPPR
jgi:23S rRNA pseudouridine2605 synthase